MRDYEQIAIINQGICRVTGESTVTQYSHIKNFNDANLNDDPTC